MKISNNIVQNSYLKHVRNVYSVPQIEAIMDTFYQSIFGPTVADSLDMFNVLEVELRYV